MISKSKIYTGALCLLVMMSCKSQNDKNIVQHFNEGNFIKFEQTIFAPAELIEACADSSGKEKLIRGLKLLDKSKANISQDERNERKIMFSLILKNLKAVQEIPEEQIDSRKFIVEQIKPYQVDFDITHEYLLRRFKTKDDMSSCPSCNSMLLILAYDSKLYLETVSSENLFGNSKSYFPTSYILQDCNVPISITKRIQTGLLEIVKEEKDDIMKNIYKQIKTCDLTNRCD